MLSFVLIRAMTLFRAPPLTASPCCHIQLHAVKVKSVYPRNKQRREHTHDTVSNTVCYCLMELTTPMTT